MTVSYERATCRLCEQPIRKLRPQQQTYAIAPAVPTSQGDPYKWETDDGDSIWFCAPGTGYHRPKIVPEAVPERPATLPPARRGGRSHRRNQA